MNWGILIPAFLLGAAGSLHCVGMCGPLALALPLGQNSTGRLAGSLFYNTGRIITYTIYGLIFGGLGQQFALFGWQQKFSIALGVVILLSVFIPWKGAKVKFFDYWITKWSGKVRKAAGKLLKQSHPISILGFGVLNGLLPCGLVYMGLAGAAATGEAIQGSLFMLCFGLGTFPSLWSVTYFGNLLRLPVRARIKKFYPLILVTMGMILILRGMNLGIPYLSPELNTARVSAIHCNGR